MKKFRKKGNKEGAIAAFYKLEEAGLGKVVEVQCSKGTSTVSLYNTEGSTGFRNPEGPGLWHPESSEGATKGLTVSKPSRARCLTNLDYSTTLTSKPTFGPCWKQFSSHFQAEY